MLYLYSVLTPVSSSAVVTDTDRSIDNKHGSLMTTRFGYQAGRNWSVLMPCYIPLYHRTTIWPFCRLILQVTAADDYLCIHYAGVVRLRSTYSAVVMGYCLYYTAWSVCKPDHAMWIRIAGTFVSTFSRHFAVLRSSLYYYESGGLQQWLVALGYPKWINPVEDGTKQVK